MRPFLVLLLAIILSVFLVGCEEAPPEDVDDEVEEVDEEPADPELLKSSVVAEAFLEIVELVRNGELDGVIAHYSTDSLAFFDEVYAEYPELGTVEEQIERSWAAHSEAFARPFNEDDYRVRNLDLDRKTAEVHWRYPGAAGELENATFFILENGVWKLFVGFPELG